MYALATIAMLIMFCPPDGTVCIDVVAHVDRCEPARFSEIAADMQRQTPALAGMRADAYTCPSKI